jgi:hypothetical protein
MAVLRTTAQLAHKEPKMLYRTKLEVVTMIDVQVIEAK